MGLALKKKRKPRKPKIILIVFLVLLIVFGGLAFWKAISTPEERSYPKMSYAEFVVKIKKGKVASLNLKYITENEDSVLTIITVKLIDGRIFRTEEINFVKIPYGEFFGQLKEGKVEDLIVGYRAPEYKEIIICKLKNGEELLVSDFPYRFLYSDDFEAAIHEYPVGYWEIDYLVEEYTFWEKWGYVIVFLVLLFIFFIYLIRDRWKIRKEKKREKEAEERARATGVTFEDIAGIDEAKKEVMEIVEMIKSPAKFLKLGAKLPRGIMISGPPGCGKTMLAKAVAAEAKAPFISVSGSEFIEKYVGTGAARIRDLFNEARRRAAESESGVIIFIDEIDSLGKRALETSGGEKEYTQTINQFLALMDGFKPKEEIFVIGATNLPEALDPALMRPGRFNRQIVIPLPDLKGRVEILKVHAGNKPLDPSVDLKKIARLTPLGFSGADLANVMNEAAIRAAQWNKDKIEMEDVKWAVEKVLIGPERRSMVIGDKDKKITSVHEGGHIIVAIFNPNAELPQKVTIIPTVKGAGGYTRFLPKEDRYLLTKKELLTRIEVGLGGRIAEEIIFGKEEISTGASEDIEKVTQIAKEMICIYAMESDKLGLRAFGRKQGSRYLGRTVRMQDYSNKTAEKVDRAIREVLDRCYQNAKKILIDHCPELEKLAKVLREKETLDISEINEILETKNS